VYYVPLSMQGPDLVIGRALPADPEITGSRYPVIQGSPIEVNGISESLLVSQRKSLVYLFFILTSLIILTSGIAGLRANPLFYIFGCLCGYFGIRRLLSPLLIWYAVSLVALVGVEIYFSYYFLHLEGLGHMTFHLVIATLAVATLIETFKLRKEINLFLARQALAMPSVRSVRLVIVYLLLCFFCCSLFE
jgi:hypothetical protein